MVVYLIGRIRDKANRFIIASLRKHSLEGFAPSHGDILYALFIKGPMSMKDLASIIHRRKSTVTTLVNKLIDAGYVNKESDPRDDRVSIISLSETGRELKETLVDISESLLSQLYQGFTDEEKKELMRLLARLHENA